MRSPGLLCFDVREDPFFHAIPLELKHELHHELLAHILELLVRSVYFSTKGLMKSVRNQRAHSKGF